jgi:hypothetical protein
MWGRRLENLNQREGIAKIAINAKIERPGQRSPSHAKDEVWLCSSSQSQKRFARFIW